MAHANKVPVFTEFSTGRHQVGTAEIHSDGTMTIKLHPSLGQRLVRDFWSGKLDGFNFNPVEKVDVIPPHIHHIAVSAENQVAVCSGEPFTFIPSREGRKRQLCPDCLRLSMQAIDQPPDSSSDLYHMNLPEPTTRFDHPFTD